MRTVLLAMSLLLAAPARAGCAGDCDGDGETRVAELIGLVRCALVRPVGDAACLRCADADASGAIEVQELVAAVADALGGCPDAAASCREDADCRDPGRQCVAPDGLLCGICRDDPDQCGGDGDCAPGAVCMPTRARVCPCDGSPALVCAPACAADADCAGGERCGHDGHCLRPACALDADCGAGYCVLGRCYDERGTCQLPPP